MMGAAARFGFRIDRSSGRPAFGGPVLPISTVLTMRGTVAFLAVWMVINLVTGLVGFVPGEESQIAWEAHIGGFVVGFFFVSSFDRPAAGLDRPAGRIRKPLEMASVPAARLHFGDKG